MLATQPTAEAVRRVSISYGTCCTNSEFFQKFYSRFTAKSAVIRDMFANTDMALQRQALRSGITFLMQFATGAAFAVGKVNQLGESHSRKRLNVPPHLYPLWVSALLETIAECDPEFDKKLEADWQAVLQPGIDRMTELHTA